MRVPMLATDRPTDRPTQTALPVIVATHPPEDNYVTEDKERVCAAAVAAAAAENNELLCCVFIFFYSSLNAINERLNYSDNVNDKCYHYLRGFSFKTTTTTAKRLAKLRGRITMRVKSFFFL